MSTNDQLSEKIMRKAVRERDQTYDGQFVYAVITTGVFCRPSCAARPAKPENLRFYRTIAEAKAAGFRPCKRCKPDDPNRDVARMAELARFIETHADEKITLSDLAERQGLSPGHLQRNFKAVFGLSPKAYQDAARLGRLKDLLKSGDSIAGAIFEAGYGSSSRVYEKAAQHIGMTPKSYRSGGTGETIHYACRPTGLGHLMMAATEKGVCFVMFGDAEEALFHQLHTEFPNATLVGKDQSEDPLLDDWMSALERHLSDGAPRPDLPLDLRGTAFQMKVWRFLMSIPDGDVVSYAEVAAGIDQPSAVRAAASACGKNRVAVLVPCHRVLRGDGSVGGYRWGLDRKRALIDAERRSASAT
ncbi:MAG: bifunctional DNA-binding transcriptional regulator/O6-methylguanine-DNA methyltransferase Ada [Pseudomonadota bacterium]